MNKTTNKRYDCIDLLEAIAILLVLLYHGTTYKFNFIDAPKTINYFRYFYRAFLSPCVPLFFFANGYLLFNRELDLKKHIHKIIRLTTITVLWWLISVLVLMPITHEILTVKEIIIKMWKIEDSGFWFMGTLMCIYIFFPILKSAFDSNRKSLNFFVIVCAAMTFGNKLICGAGTVLARVLINYPTVIRDNVFNMFNPFQGIHWFAFVYFCLGGMIYEYVPRIMKNQRKLNTVSALTLAGSALLLTVWSVYLSKLTGEIWDIVWGGYDTVFTLVNVLAIFVLCLNYKPQKAYIKKAVETVSRNTLGIYFIHEIYVKMTIYSIREMSIAQNVLGNIVYALSIMAVCLITIFAIKKIPVVRKLLV